MNKEKLCRNTIQKQLVIDTVNELHTHPSAEEIYNAVVEKAPHISKATVYRNLAHLSEIGEILKIEVPNASDRFDFNTKPHHHMKCTMCGRLSDVEFSKELDVMGNAKSVMGDTLTGYQLLFAGVCKSCTE